MKEVLGKLTKEQMLFICKECGVTEQQLNAMSEDELYDVYDAMCDIEVAEIPSDNEPENERCVMASGIVTLLGNTMMEEYEDDESGDADD